MLCSREFHKLSNFTRFHNFTQLNSAVRWKTLHTTSIVSQQDKNQSSSNDKIRVYYGSLSKNIKSVKVFSLTTSFAGVIAQPMLYDQAAKLGTSTPLIAVMCGTVGFFTFVTPFLLHVITKRYVTELFYNPSTREYTAEVITFFLTKQRITFRCEDVTVPEIPGMFTSFLVKPKSGSGKPIALFVDPKLFDDPSHYVKIMGFDKPIDFKFEELRRNAENDENNAKKK